MTMTMTTTEPKLLSECGTQYIIDNSEKDHYQVNIQEGENQIVVIGFNAKKPASKFQHPNISATVKRVHEFKHYRRNSKFWTSQAGVDHYLVIPRNKITLLPEKGYSYVKAEINGVQVTFNVSGGTMNGWTDMLGVKSHISVNHKLSDLKKLTEVAIPQILTDIKQPDEDELKRWNEIVAKGNPNIKEAIAKLIEAEKNPCIKLVAGLTIKSGYGTSVRRRRGKKKMLSENSWTYNEDGALKKVIGIFNGTRYNIKLSQIDWEETAKANNIA